MFVLSLGLLLCVLLFAALRWEKLERARHEERMSRIRWYTDRSDAE